MHRLLYIAAIVLVFCGCQSSGSKDDGAKLPKVKYVE